jgi:hypothetical protein
MVRTKMVTWAIIVALTAIVVSASTAGAAGNRNPLRLQFSERACTLTASARWHNVGFTPADARFDFYRTGFLVSEVINPLSPGDAKSVATYAGTTGTTSNQFWVVVYLERFPGDPSYAGAVSKTIIADCD